MYHRHDRAAYLAVCLNANMVTSIAVIAVVTVGGMNGMVCGCN